MVSIIAHIDIYIYRYFFFIKWRKMSEKNKYSNNIKQNYLFMHLRLFLTFYSAQGKYKYLSGLVHLIENNSGYFSRNIF